VVIEGNGDLQAEVRTIPWLGVGSPSANYLFAPQADITPFELAIVVNLMLGGIMAGVGAVAPQSADIIYAAMTADERRHVLVKMKSQIVVP